MEGSQWEPVPGKQQQHIHVPTDDDGTTMGEEVENLQAATGHRYEEHNAENVVHPDRLQSSRKAIARYG